MKLCSACLLGIRCRYNGKSKPDKKVLELAKKESLIPVCPEQLGGASTPRLATEVKGEHVYNIEGADVTDVFVKGAEEVYKIAKLLGIKEAILKQNSPSCGVGKIYDGTFSGKKIKGDGITAAYLKSKGMHVISEDNL